MLILGCLINEAGNEYHIDIKIVKYFKYKIWIKIRVHLNNLNNYHFGIHFLGFNDKNCFNT
jgi:hypothetical protein